MRLHLIQQHGNNMIIFNDNLGIKQPIIEKLKLVYDPEIPVHIYELGLVYEVKISPDGVVNVLMTLTAPGCPASDLILNSVEQRLLEIPGVKEVRVEITFDPPWDRDMMSEEAKLELGFM